MTMTNNRKRPDLCGVTIIAQHFCCGRSVYGLCILTGAGLCHYSLFYDWSGIQKLICVMREPCWSATKQSTSALTPLFNTLWTVPCHYLYWDWMHALTWILSFSQTIDFSVQCLQNWFSYLTKDACLPVQYLVKFNMGGKYLTSNQLMLPDSAEAFCAALRWKCIRRYCLIG